MTLIHFGAAVSLLLQVAAAPHDPAPVVRRLAATAELAAQEYRLGVANGQVVARAEVEEARLFLIEAKRSAAQLPTARGAAVAAELDRLIALVVRTGSPDSLDAGVRALTTGLARDLGVSLEEIPDRAPSLARGAEVYAAQCASCHGARGLGDGPAGVGLDPAPPNLTDAAALATVSPLDMYRRVTIGVVGTAMPAFEAKLSTADRWAVAHYAATLHLPPASGDVPAALASYAGTAAQTDSALAAALGGSASDPAVLARVAAVRASGSTGVGDADAVLARVREQVDAALALAATGKHADASALAFDSYMTFEQVERDVRAKNPALADELETAFAALRTRTAGGATSAELQAVRATLFGGLENAQRALGDTLSPMSLFVQSLVLLLREGLEAILIVGALLTFLVKSGAAHRRRHIHLGVGAALVASLVTAVLLETVIHLSPARREVIEGFTMVAAAGVLFYVSYWLLSKIEVVRWTHFVKSKVHDAVTSGSAFALASAAFLAVYREGFETVLFYKALVLAGAPGQTLVPVLGGMVLGGIALALVYLAIDRFGVKIPLKPFFAITGAFLYYMAFVFAGRGVAELQEGGLVPTTVLPWAPRIPALGIYPTLESLAAQLLLLALFVGALFYTFVVAPRRLKVTSVMVPEPDVPRAAPAAGVDPAVVEGVAPIAGDTRTELVRSLERMEGDLAALRAEVERMRDQVRQGSDAPGSPRR